MPRFDPDLHTFNPRPDADPRPGAYYISVIDGDRFALAAGPFTTHAEALSLVDQVRRLVRDLDDRGFWFGYGTCRLEPDPDGNPVGKLNDLLRKEG